MNRIQGQDFVLRGAIFLAGAVVVLLLTGSWLVAGLAAIGGLVSYVVGVRAMRQRSQGGEGLGEVKQQHPLLGVALLAIGVAAIVAVFLWRVTS